MKTRKQFDDVDIEEMDIIWQITMIAIRYERKNCPSKGTNVEEGETLFSRINGAGKERAESKLLLDMVLVLSIGRTLQLEEERDNLALWQFSSNNEIVDSGMTSNSKVGLGYEIQSNNEVLSYEEEMNRTVFKCTEGDFLNKPLYSRFTKTDSFKGVPHPLIGDYTPKPQEEIDDSFDMDLLEIPSEHSSVTESDSHKCTNELSTSMEIGGNAVKTSEGSSTHVQWRHSGIFDSGCSGHLMAGNKDHRDDFEES
ncbi:hypothetical protein Tco_1042502 [Tanacetum coccineum]|uniref:Uncharacterized protein n=1 Tax=Tanacetum coccineum TaxID=301880 RepID=A0ABQ5GLE5_9ASTR